MEEFYPDELFHFVEEESTHPDPDIGRAGPGPSTMAQTPPPPPPPRNTYYSLDDDEDKRVEDIHPDAGQTIYMDKTVHQRWQDLFGPGKDREGDVLMGEGTFLSSGRANGYAPFASELDWRVANWAIREGVGHNAFDRLLAIPGVRLMISFP